MYFIPPRVSKERTLFVEGDKEAVSWDKRGRAGGGEQEKGTNPGGKESRVREAEYSDPQIHLPNLSPWKRLYLKIPYTKKS